MGGGGARPQMLIIPVLLIVDNIYQELNHLHRHPQQIKNIVFPERELTLLCDLQKIKNRFHVVA